MSEPGRPAPVRGLSAVLGLALLCVGCAGARVQVMDATTGGPVAGAEVALEDADGQILAQSRSGSSGLATITSPARASLLYVGASGYRASGTPWPPQHPAATTEVALQPGWVGDFVEHPAHPVPPLEIIPAHVCPCRQ